MSRAVQPTAQPEVTDWIPCTTPPVRDGAYQYMMPDSIMAKPMDAVFKNGEWFDPSGAPLPGLHQSQTVSRLFVWRGVRRWVLVKRDHPLCACDVYVKKRTPRTTYLSTLEHAIGFDTKEKAEAYRDKGRPFGDFAGIEAVLP